MKRFTLIHLLFLLVLLASTAIATVPKLINFQGVLRDGSGNPVADASYSVTFTIYDAATGGNNLWTETQSVSTTSGLFAVLLGTSNPVPDTAFKGSDRWLGIAVSPDPEMSPRQQLVSVPFAMGNWSSTGNSGTSPGTNFLGTTDNQALELKVQGSRALRIEPTPASPNLIGGYPLNSGTSGVWGATIGGGGRSGLTNRVTDDFGTVGGGFGNIAGDNGGTTSDRSEATVGGGSYNAASHFYATVGGGTRDSATGIASTVSGGQSNIAGGSYATVAGGISNVSNGLASTVSGGQLDTASGNYSTVGGGHTNTASGISATIGGGVLNNAGGSYATIPGGLFNFASGHYSLAAGRRAKAIHTGAFVWADSQNVDFASTAANQFLIRASNVGIGLNNPSKKLEVAGSIKVGTSDTVFSSNISSNSPLTLQAPAGTTRIFVDDGTGSVGIGTASPFAKLHLSLGSGEGISPGGPGLLINNNAVAGATAGITVVAGSAGTAFLNFGDNLSAAQGGLSYDNASDNLSLRTNGLLWMTIGNTGNVGIGTTTPANKLDVEGGAAVGATYSGTSAAPANGLLVEGNVGIGTASPVSGTRLTVNGGIATAITTVSGTLTLGDAHSMVLCDAAGGAITVNLPTAVGRNGRQYTIKKIDGSGNAVTIDPAGGESIDFFATYTLSTTMKYVTIVSNGSHWFVVANN
ncbi:MAG: hypothetical protein L0196_02835 [candidate division Zixibacteria bacterium]|nr:hypothetical protein [candidate division Zixibacteria bacterium]